MEFTRLIFGHRTPRRSHLIAWLAVATLSTMAAVSFLGSMVGRESSAPPVDLQGLAVFLFIAVLMILSQFKALDLTTAATEAAVDDLRTRFGRAVRFADPRAVERVGTARLFAAMTRATTVVEEAGAHVIYGIVTGAVMIAVAVYLLFVSPPAFLVIVFFGGGTAFLYLRRKSDAEPAQAEARAAEQRYLDLFVQLLDGHKEVRLGTDLGQDLVETHLTAAEAECHARKSAAAAELRQAHLFAYGGIYLLLAAMVFGLPQYLGAEAPVSKVILSTLFLLLSVNVLMRALPIFGRANAALADLDGLIGTLAPVQASKVGLARGGAFREIALESVQLREGGPLHTAVLRPGTVTAIEGPNGSGRTYLMKTICALALPLTGVVRVDGIALDSETDRSVHRERCSAVFEDGHLFDRLYGLDDVEDRDLLELIGQAGVPLAVIGAGRQVDVGALSPQMAQRLMVISAVMSGRPLLLFDDVLVGQDEAFRRWFAQVLLPRLRLAGRCVVLTGASGSGIRRLADQVIEPAGECEPERMSA